MTDLRHRVRIPATLESLADVRSTIRAAATACGAPIDCEDDLVQAVDEAVTNVILHGYRGAAGWVEVAAGRTADDLIVTISDGGPTFDPLSVPAPDPAIPPAHRRPGGMGVHLMRQAADTIVHRPRPGGGNILTITRRLRRTS
jgi:serine/threonine-protein kinase RsbW